MSDSIDPSETYSHWLIINEALPLLTTDEAITGTINEFQPNEYNDKVPADVLDEAVVFNGKLDTLRKRHELDETHQGNIPDADQVTPAVVKEYSSHIFDGIKQLAAQINDANKDYNFHNETVTGKQASDVFGLVNLANRKIDLLK